MKFLNWGINLLLNLYIHPPFKTYNLVKYLKYKNCLILVIIQEVCKF